MMPWRVIRKIIAAQHRLHLAVFGVDMLRAVGAAGRAERGMGPAT